jgi:folate-dependent phosphoribosylglycinamide formyltransferase PurN
VSVPIAVFASGSGTNLQSLLDRFTNSEIAHIALVISDRADAAALQRARDANVDWLHIPVRDRPTDDVAHETLTALTAHDIQLIALGGYLRLVPSAVVERYRNRILNIHPALLPSFGGKGMYGTRVHAAVLDAGCTVTGGGQGGVIHLGRRG